VLARRLTAVAIALASAAGIAGCGDEYTKGAGVYSTTSTTPAVATTTTTPTLVEPEPVQTTDAGGTESSEVGKISAAQRRDVREASAAARSFLDGYLPYSYGRRPATLIRSVSAQLRRTLARDAPRVPLDLQKKARPRLRGLQLSGITGRQVIMLARIDDGQSRYAALITVQRQGHRWAVSRVQ
jgi:hypothetical protein